MSERQPGSRPITIDANSESDSTARSRLSDSATDVSESLPFVSFRSACPDANILTAFTSGLLPLDTCEAIAQHVEECEACQRLLDEQSYHVPHDAMHEALAALAHDSQMPSIGPALREVIQALAPPANELPSFPGYEHFHEYQLLEEIGTGGMGTVYRALHTRLNKEVAVKTISPAAFTIPGAVSRFESEMRALGQISHPNIVSASDAGVFEHTHYLVMEYIKGADLAEILKARGRLDVPLVIHILSQVCAGLSAAHRCGLVHRDIKPSNIMLVPDAAGLGVVKILDLGLSALHPDVALAQPTANHVSESIEVDVAAQRFLANQDAIVGTFDYMAPEQAHRGVAPGPSMDLYSLGCTCFHLLVGRAPFRQFKLAENSAASDKPWLKKQSLAPMAAREKLAAHANSPVPNVKQFRDDVPDWLCQLVQRLMAKDPSQRPQSVDEVLTCIAQAKSDSESTKRTNRILLTALAMFAFLLCGVVYRLVTDKGTLEITPLDENVQVEISQNGKRVKIIDTENSNRIELHSGQFDLKVANRQDVTIDKTKIELKRGDKVVVQLNFLPVSNGATSAAAGDRLTVQQAISSAIKGDLKLPGLRAVLGQPISVENLQGLHVKTLEYSPDGNWLAAATSNIGGDEEALAGELLIIQAKSGRVHQRLRPHASGINQVAWIDGSQLVISGGYDGCLVVTDPNTGQQRNKFELDGRVHGFGISESGKLLAVACGHTVYILEWPGGTILHRLKTQGPSVEHVAFRGDTEVVSNRGESPNHVWTLGDVPELKTFRHHGGRSADIYIPKTSLAADAEPIVWTSGYDGQALAWNTQTGKVSRQLLHPWVASSVHLNADGTQVLTSDWDGPVLLWKATTGQLQKVVTSSGPYVSRFSPDGKSVAAGSYYNTVYAVDVETGQPIWSTRVARFDSPPAAADEQPSLDRYAHTSGVMQVCSSEATRRLASAALDGSVNLWDSDSNRLLGPLDHQGGQAILLEFVDRGQRLVAVTRESFITEWDVAARKTLQRQWLATSSNVRVTAAALDPRGDLVALARESQGIELWSRKEQRLIRKLQDTTSRATQLTFSEDGQLVWAIDRGRLCCWEVETGLEKRVPGIVGAQITCRLGNRLLVASTQNKVNVLDNQGKKLFEFETPHGQIGKMKASPQADRVFVASLVANRVSVWQLDADKARLLNDQGLLPEQLQLEQTDCDWDFGSQRSFVGHLLGVIVVGQAIPQDAARP